MANLVARVVQAFVVPEAFRDAGQNVGDKRIVAGESAGDDVAMHHYITDGATVEAQTLQQALLGASPAA